MMRKAIIVFSRLYDFGQDRYEIGGIETYIRNLCPVLIDCGLEAHVVFPGGRSVEILRDGMHLHSLVGDSETPARKLVRTAESVGAVDRDLLIFGTSSLVCRTRFAKTIGIQHGVYWDVEQFHGRPVASRGITFALSAAQALRQLRFHSLVSNMVCVDLNYVNWMRSLTAGSRLPYTYIPNFAELVDPSERIQDGKVRIIFARRFEEVRGCRQLIQVLPRVLFEHPEVELTIAGRGSLDSEIHSCFDGNPQVKFTVYDATDSVRFHQKFDIALVPSVGSEGTSLSLLEAMSAGCAAIATDIGGMSNIIIDGYNGLIIRPTESDLYAAINQLVEDQRLRLRISSEGKKTIIAAFSREIWAKKWVAAVNETMGL